VPNVIHIRLQVTRVTMAVLELNGSSLYNHHSDAAKFADE
jgi:hypothetical protein